MTREPLRPFLSNVMRLLDPYSFLKNAGFSKEKLMTKALQATSTQMVLPNTGIVGRFRILVPNPPFLVPSGPTPQTGVNLSGWILLPLLCEYYIWLNLLALGGNQRRCLNDWPIRTAFDCLHDG